MNWHLMPNCNYQCVFCFQTFEGKHRWIKDIDAAIKILKKIADSGIYKITFSGGEPFLHPKIDMLIGESKRLGLTTSVVTNGFLLDSERLKQLAGYLDILAISIDSQSEDTEKHMGRGNGTHVFRAKEIALAAKVNGIRLKINSVVTRHNVNECMAELIEELRPERWKIFQFLPIQGEAGFDNGSVKITAAEFDEYVTRNRAKTSVKVVAEANDDMLGSYLMLDPEGYVLRNNEGRYESVAHILEDDLGTILSASGFDIHKFVGRDGDYF
jgi:radical S-adenosyl methionine domain-containing protein 2